MVAGELMLYTWGGLCAALKQPPRVVEYGRKRKKKLEKQEERKSMKQ